MVHFWASEVTETKAAVVKVPEGFVLNVCNATLASDAGAIVSLGLETTQMDRKNWKGVVAHLGAAAHAHQVKLDLVFGATPQVKFYVAKGAGKVNLTGYFQPGPPADLFDAAPATATPAKQTQQSSKKRARDEPVTWDQVRERVRVSVCQCVCVCVHPPVVNYLRALSVRRRSRPSGIGTCISLREFFSRLLTHGP